MPIFEKVLPADGLGFLDKAKECSLAAYIDVLREARWIIRMLDADRRVSAFWAPKIMTKLLETHVFQLQ